MVLAKNIKAYEWIEVIIIDDNYSDGLVEVELYEDKYNGARFIVRKENIKIILIDEIFSKGLELIENDMSLEKVKLLLNIATRYEKYLHRFNMKYIIGKLNRLKIDLM